MFFLLPPSETKLSGGHGPALSLPSLSYPGLTDARRSALHALAALGGDAVEVAKALKLSAKAAVIEGERNRRVATSATMPAVERYTGVLFDALAVHEWGADARARASDHLLVHSALFGVLAADDPIPVYRLSHDSRLPGLPLRAHWAAVNTAVLQGLAGPLIDLRSAGYAALGPLPDRDDAVAVRVVARGDDGVARALNHFNKKGKGEFVRTLFAAGALPASIDALCVRSTDLGWPLRRLGPTELELVVPGTLP